MITNEVATGAVLGFMAARCDVRSQHKLPSIEEITSTAFAEFICKERVRALVFEMIADGRLINYDGYISDREISVL